MNRHERLGRNRGVGPRRRYPAAMAVAAVLALGGCGTLRNDSDLGYDGAGDRIKTIVPNKSVSLTPSVHIPLEGLLLGAAVYWVVDPLSPNWQTGEARIGQDTVRISLKRKPFVTGGQGEATQVFRRRAEQVTRQLGFTAYTVLEFNEGIESSVPFAQRVAEGVIRVSRGRQ